MIVHIEAFTCSCGNTIPKKYTCDGEEISPGIKWDDVPQETKSFVLMMEDLDVPNRSNPLTIWIVYNIPGDIREIETNSLPEQAKIGVNDLGKVSYSGPCPEPGPDHQRYRMQLYALDTKLDVPSGTMKHTLMSTMKDHILATAESIATYKRHA